MASGDDKAASKAGHMAAPTSTCKAQLTLAKGEPSTQGALPPGRSSAWTGRFSIAALVKGDTELFSRGEDPRANGAAEEFLLAATAQNLQLLASVTARPA